jgi:hypothetical protein
MMATINNKELLSRIEQGVKYAHLTYIVFSQAQLAAVTAAAEDTGCVYSVLEDRGRRSAWDMKVHEVLINGSPEELADHTRKVAVALETLDGR